MTEYENLLGRLNVSIAYPAFLEYLCALEARGLITLYAGTYSLSSASQMWRIEQASFYFYYNENKEGFRFYINRMGSSLKKDDGLFSFSHRRLYSKRYLSNCFFGEPDFRSGAFFRK